MTNSNRVLNNVQGIRAIAAVMVIFVHLSFLLGSIDVPNFGFGGIDLFFVTSGFIMFYTTSARPMRPLDFMANRFARIAPPYWLLTALVFALSLLVPSLLGSPDRSPLDFFKSLAFIPFAKPNGTVEPDLFIGWTLNYEMFFYVLFSLCLFVKNYRSGIGLLLILLTILASIGMIIHPTHIIAGFYTASIILEFGMGILVGIVATRMPVLQTRLQVCSMAVAGILAFEMIILAAFIAPHVPSAFTCGPAAFIVLLAAVTFEKSGWRIAWKPLLAIGNASYSIYLTHPFITQIFQKFGARFHTTGLASAALIIAGLITVCVVGYGFHIAVERPTTAFARRVLGARRLRPVAVR